MFKTQALERQQTEGTQPHSNFMRTFIWDNIVYINIHIRIQNIRY